MATSSSTSILFILFIALTCPASLFGTQTPSSSFTSLNQLKFWSENVQSRMPNYLLSKLSPLNNKEVEHFSSFVTKRYVPSDANFCSRAKLACLSKTKFVPNAMVFYNIISPSLAEHVDPGCFFRISLLKEGNKVRLSKLESQYPLRSFLPSEIASKISIDDQSDLQKIFPESFKNLPTKDAILSTLFYCNTPDLKDEIQTCTKSLKDMIEFSKTAVGSKSLVSLTTKNTEGSGKEVLIGTTKKINFGKTVSCHELFLPFMTYFCHLLSKTEVYAVEILEPKTKLPVNTVMVICHTDTSFWSPNHVAFKLLKSSPGQGEACHWMSQNELIWAGKGKN